MSYTSFKQAILLLAASELLLGASSETAHFAEDAQAAEMPGEPAALGAAEAR